MKRIITALNNHKPDDIDLARLKRLMGIFLNTNPNDLIVLSGPLIYTYRELIENDTNESIQKLLDEDYSKYIYQGTEEDSVNFILNLIEKIKESWKTMSTPEQNIIRSNIKKLLAEFCKYRELVYSSGDIGKQNHYQIEKKYKPN